MRCSRRASDTRVMNRTINVAGIVLVLVAIATCLLLGTFGWFAVGFTTMTDCTNNYSCSQTGCKPCVTTSRWITGGAAAQWLLAATGVAVLIRGTRVKQPTYLEIGGAVLLAVSAMVFVGTTWRAQESYCQPGSSGYNRSYCSIEA